MLASIHAPAIAIETPLHALKVNKTAVTNSETKSSHKVISGYWVGIVDLQSLKGSLKNLNHKW